MKKGVLLRSLLLFSLLLTVTSAVRAQRPAQQNLPPPRTTSRAPQSQTTNPAAPAGGAEAAPTGAAAAESAAPQKSRIVYGGLNLQNASLTEVVDMLARQLKINYVLDPRIKGGVILNTYGETKNIDTRDLLDAILRINNAAMVKEGELFRIVPLTDINREPLEPLRLEAKDIPTDEQEMLNLVFLKYTTSDELMGVLKTFQGPGAQIYSYGPANLLLLLDSRRNMHRTMELVSMFDNDALVNQRVHTYEVTNGRPSDIAKELEDIFKGIAFNGKNSPIRFLPVDRLNTIIAVAPNPGAFAEVQKWVDKLDVPAKSTAGDVDNYVYRVKYGDAQCLAQAIMSLYSGYQMGVCPTQGALGRSGASGYGAGGYGMGGYGGGGYGGGGYGMGMGGYGAAGYGAQAYVGATGINNPYTGAAAFGSGLSNTGAPGSQLPAPITGAGVRTEGAGQDLTGQYMGAQSMYSRMRGPRVIANPYANTLMIQATPQDYLGVMKLVRDLDLPPRQVLIQAQIYEVDLTGAFSSGVSAYLQKLGATASNTSSGTGGTGTTGGGSGQTVGTSNPFGGVTTGSTSTATTPSNSLTASIPHQVLGSLVNGSTILTGGMLVGMSRELLAAVNLQVSKTKAKVISAPSIIATDSIPASINVGESVPTLSSTAATGVQSGGSSLFANTISNQDTGVTLNVTARVNTSGIVTMMINQEVSAPIPPAAGGINSPSFNKRTVQTQVTVQDGDMIAIGGIIDENTTSSSSGIPFLHELPYVGGLFGSRTYSKQRTELVIFLTPHVIYDTNQIVDATEELKSGFKMLRPLLKNDR